MSGQATPATDPEAMPGSFGRLFGPSPSARARRVLLLLLFPALILVVTLRFDFVFDDNIVILGDALVTGQFSLGGIFGSEVRVADVALGYYRPLITLLYRADRALWGLNAAGYHLTSLVFHLLATLLVYRIALRSTRRLVAAWAAAMLFGVLPAHTEAIGWIQGRVDLVSTTLVLLALLALLHAREAPGTSGWPWAALAGLTFLLALLAKETAGMLPLAWAAWEISTPRQGHSRERLAAVACRFLPLILAGLVYWMVRRITVGQLVGFPVSFSPIGLRALALLSILAEYGRVLLFPDLALNFHRVVRAAPTPAALAIGLTVAGVLAGGLVALWRRARPLFPWGAWLPITLAPPLLFVLYAPAPELGFLTAERFLYLPSVGWCVLLGALIARVMEGWGPTRWSWRGTATFGGLVAGYAGLTLLRLLPWADAAGLYLAMQARAGMPLAMQVLVHNNLGKVYLERGEFSSAREQFQAALRLKPNHAFALNNLGVLLIREGRPAEARPWIERAIRIDPTYGDAYGNLGAAYEAAGDLPAARRAYEAGLRVAPTSAWLAQGLSRVNAAIVESPISQAGTSR